MSKAMLTDRRTQVRFAKFLAVGATAYGVQLGTMAVVSHLLAAHLAFSVSWTCATATHYLLNRFWALPSARADAVRQFQEYAGVAVISYVLNFAVFHLCFGVIGLGSLWSTAIAVPPSTVVVFSLLNFRVFRAGKLNDDPA